MAYDAFMWLEGGSPAVKGETTDSVYKAKNAFEVVSFSWSAHNPTTIGSKTGGAGAGRVSLSSFSIMKRTDAASPAMFANCCKGQHFPHAHVVLRKAGGSALEYLKYDFDEVFIETMAVAGSSGGDESPHENIAFVFGRMSIEYDPQLAKGDKGSKITAGWDMVSNKAI